MTVHAGEAAGAESMWQAINKLGATRIGHGVKAIEDPKLMDYLAENRIGIESCLTSNIQTSTVASLANHPLKQFLDHGVLACLNTDDPAVEGIELPYEYEVAAPAAGGGDAGAGEEKTEFTVVLKSPGGAKLQVVKAVKELTGLGSLGGASSHIRLKASAVARTELSLFGLCINK